MPRQLAVEVENNFSGGLITQATGLNFPPNACTETDNCIFHELGYAERRPGFDFEDNFETKTINRTSSAVVNYFWKNVSGDGTVNLLVAQIGEALYFWYPSNAGFSAGALATTVNLNSFKPSGAPSPKLAECQFASGLGHLFVTHPTLDPFYVDFDTVTETVAATEITVQIRDTEGVEDDLDPGERPAVETAESKYNAYNQGWYVSSGSYYTSFETAMSVYPSNADTWWLYKNFDDIFDTTTITSVIYDRGTSESAKGHYILEAFNQDRSTVSGIATLDVVDSGYQRPSAVAFFSGRVWYAGVASSGFESKIYFSQILMDISQAGHCYSREDPSSENYNQLEVDDGGWLTIPGIGLIRKIVALASGLIVFGSQGIFQITGSTGTGFTAMDYSVQYLSSVKALSASSFVDVDGFPAWWTIEGIYILTPSNNALSVQSLTDQKIKEMYLDIPLSCKRMARGAYDPRSHTIQWIYRDTEPQSLTETYEFDNILNFNTLSGAFFPWSLPTSDVKLNGVFLSEGFGADASIDNIIVGAGNNVIVGAGNNVVNISFGALVLEFSNKYLVSYPFGSSYKFTFADYANTIYRDWYSYDDVGVDYTSTFTTGYKIPTQGAKRFNPSYLYLFSDLSDIKETDFYFQSIWNYANSEDSGKISSQQRITHTLGNFDIVRNKLKVRGSGYVVQFKYASITGKPFRIIGWTVSNTLATRD